MFIWEILLIISLAGMFTILVRRLPQAVVTARRQMATPVSEAASLSQSKAETAAVKAISETEPPAPPLLELSSKKTRLPKVKTEEVSLAQAERAYKARDFTKAARLFEILLEANDADLKLRNRLGLAYLELEQFHAARNQFRLVLKKGGEGVASYHANLAMAEFGFGHHLTAIRHLKRAIAMAPNNKQYQDLLDTIETERG